MEGEWGGGVLRQPVPDKRKVKLIPFIVFGPALRLIQFGNKYISFLLHYLQHYTYSKLDAILHVFSHTPRTNILFPLLYIFSPPQLFETAIFGKSIIIQYIHLTFYGLCHEILQIYQ